MAASVAVTPVPSGNVWSAVALLSLVTALNYIDRFLPAVLAEPIKRELELSDTALGLINGFGFLAVYAVVGIPIARLADRGAYGTVITTCLGLWSVMTMLGGAVSSGWQLAATRMGVALGEAGSTPAAHAFISRNFPPERRARPLAVLTAAAPISSMLALIAGGLLGAWLGWRMTFVLMGITGLLLAPLVFVVMGRAQPAIEAHRQTGFGEALVLFRKRSFVMLVLVSAFISIAGYSATSFGPAFMMRVHDLSLARVGVELGIANGLVGLTGMLVIGAIADRLQMRDPRWLLWAVVLMICISIPFSILALNVSDPRAATYYLALSYIVGATYLVPVVAAIHRLAPPHLRATASAILLFFTAILGGLGPLITGAISDALTAEFGAMALSRALLVMPVAYAVAGLLCLAAALSFVGEIEDEAA